MAEFTYSALNAAGKEIKGNVVAENRDEALSKIKAKELTPLNVTEANALNKSMEFGFGKKMQKFVFYTNYSGWQHIVVWIVAMFLLLMSIAALNVSSFSPFIYFRF